MNGFLKAIFIFLFVSKIGGGFSQTVHEDRISGTWKGASICQVKDSPCHDEMVIYHINRSAATGIYSVQANKVVNNVEQEMGELEFEYDKASGTLLCKKEDRFHSVWKFTVNGNSMQGTLTINEKTLYRIIQLQKQ
jgi:hypothetical protein